MGGRPGLSVYSSQLEEKHARRGEPRDDQGHLRRLRPGDVETILSAVADDVDWAVDADPVAPWYGQRSGKEGVASFFADIASSTEVQDFALLGIGASDHEVFAFLRFAVRMTATGREASFHLHHYFNFGDDGKIKYYRCSEDSAQVAKALAGAQAA